MLFWSLDRNNYKEDDQILFMKKEVSAVVFINGKNEILIYLRDKKNSIPYPNKWSILGGHIEEGEEPIDALKREVKEEIGYDIGQSIYLDHFNDGVGNKVYVYKSRINKEIRELNLTEGQKLGYFSFEDLMKLNLIPELKSFIAKYKDEILDL